MATRRRCRAMAATVAAFTALAIVAACGTRLPDSRFATPPPNSSATTSTTPSSTGGSTDVGVTAGEITIGNISSITNLFDPNAFTGGYDGAKAWFAQVNREGGVNGRQVRLVSCDDGGSAMGNVECVRSLTPKVFAFASNTILAYGGAQGVDDAGVPDIGGQPIDTAYYRYPHLWSVYGESYPRDGTSYGYDGVLTGGTEVYRYFAVRFPTVPRKAGVIYYNQVDSRKYGESIVTGLRAEGYHVVSKQINFALPDYDSAVIAMRQAGVAFVYDALDRLGSQRLCAAMDRNRLYVTAKVTTTQSWVASTKRDYADAPRCRNSIWATGTALNYDDTSKPQVASFRSAMQAQGLDTVTTMSEWALEGWAGAMWLTDAMRSCGARLTRSCVETFMARAEPYDAGGLLQPRDFVKQTEPSTTDRNCLNVVRWQDAANGGRGGWVNQVEDMNSNCFTVHVIRYHP